MLKSFLLEFIVPGLGQAWICISFWLHEVRKLLSLCYLYFLRMIATLEHHITDEIRNCVQVPGSLNSLATIVTFEPPTKYMCWFT